MYEYGIANPVLTVYEDFSCMSGSRLVAARQDHVLYSQG